MARRANEGGRVRPDRNPSVGAAVLERPVGGAAGTATTNLLQEEILRVVFALQQGRLAERARVDQFQGSDRTIADGLNGMLDAVIKPLNVSAEYVDRISKGEVPPKITDTYNGDFNEIKNNLNALIGVVQMRNQDLDLLIDAAMAGQLSVRADADKYTGENGKLIRGINQLLDTLIKPLNVSAEYVDRISKGDIPPKITDSYNGDFNEIKNNLNNCIDNIGGLIAEMKRMSEEHNRGDIDVAIPAEKFQGAYRVMAQGVNDMVAGHIAVKRKAMACIAEFGKGNFEAPLERFPGKKAFINDTIEQVRINLKALIADAVTLVKAAVEGKLATRADATKHQGDFRKIVEGVNQTLDAVIKPLNVSAEYVDRISKGDIPPKITDTYNGDFNEIKNNLNTCIDAISRVVTDGAALTQAAVEGKLATRADASKHQGDFRKVDRGLQPDAGQRHQAPERLRRVRGPHLEGRHPAQDHRHLQRRLQRDQEQPQQLHRQHQRAGRRRRHAGQSGGGRQTGHPRRRHQASGRLPQDRRRRQPDAGRGHQAPERLRRVRGPHLEGRHPAQDHRHLQRRFQRDQEQPEQLHRQHPGAGGRDRHCW